MLENDFSIECPHCAHSPNPLRTRTWTQSMWNARFFTLHEVQQNSSWLAICDEHWHHCACTWSVLSTPLVWGTIWAEPKYIGFVPHSEFRGVSGFNGFLVLGCDGTIYDEPPLFPSLSKVMWHKVFHILHDFVTEKNNNKNWGEQFSWSELQASSFTNENEWMNE